jgi:hypothetical protein
MRAVGVAPVAVVVFVVALAACGGADPGRGLELRLRVEGAQLVRAGELPPTAGGPAVTAIDTRFSAVRVGEGGRTIAGRAAGGAYAVNLWLEGEPAYWVRPIGLPDPAVAGELEWAAVIAIAPSMPAGPFTLWVQAVDGDGRPGGPAAIRLTAIDPTPAGELVIALEWDRDADLDLFVTDPDGNTVGGDNPNTYRPPLPGEPPAPADAWMAGGILDVDSNADCLIDGLRREHVVWTRSPPVGRYVVRVGMFAPCGQAAASFRVRALRGGALVAEGGGTLYALDARSAPSKTEPSGALEVLGFDVQ